MNKVFLGLLLVSALALSNFVNAKVTGIKSGKQMVQEVASSVKNISTAELKKEIDSNPDLVLVDIRTYGEIKSLGGAIDATQNVNIPRGWLEFRIAGHAQSKDTPIVVYCGGNIRSPLAAHTLTEMGYTNVRNYADGFLGWKKAKLPISKP
ncbi:MAG TPA: hypothetical protein ENJ41_06015 [Oceanospirillales bacterium]|nr:hypothetical protein [Oceanospirillales bacterium]